MEYKPRDGDLKYTKPFFKKILLDSTTTNKAFFFQKILILTYLVNKMIQIFVNLKFEISMIPTMNNLTRVKMRTTTAIDNIK